MNVLDKVEQKGFFNLTRWLAFVIVGLLSISIIIASLFLIKTFTVSENVHISPKEVISSFNKQENGSTSNQESIIASKSDDVLEGLKMPPILLDIMDDPANRNVIRNYLVNIENDNRQSFLDEMADTIAKARESKIGDSDAANAYVAMYKKRQLELQELVSQQKTKRMYSLGIFATSLLLLALFSLVLVLLAIERNTRKSPE